MAAIQNLVIDQGTTFSLIFNITNVDGTAKDLTSYTGSSHLRKSYYTNTYTAFTVAKDNLEGEITISLTATQTSALKAGRYVYDVEIVSNVETLRVLEGIITVTPEATR